MRSSSPSWDPPTGWPPLSQSWTITKAKARKTSVSTLMITGQCSVGSCGHLKKGKPKMEHISKAVAKLEEKLPERTSSVPARRSNAASVDEILVIIGRLELKKQIKALGDRQRVELAELLYKLNESKERIGRRADSVVLLETYGTIAFQYWVQDEVALRSEIDQELYRLKCLDEDRHLSFRLA